MFEVRDKRRRTLLTNRPFQLSFLGFTCAIAFLCIDVFYIATRYTFHRLEKSGQQIGLPEDHIYFQVLQSELTTVYFVFFVAAGLSLAVIMIGGLILSHRVAGPVEKIRKHLSDFTETGQGQPLHFRSKDYFPELADAYNKALEKFKKP